MSVTYSDSTEINRDSLSDLFRAAEWKSADYPEQLQQAVRNSHSVISAWEQGRLVGIVNALSDGVMTVYFHYMLVHPDYQNQGIGRTMMELILAKYEGYKTKLLVSYEHAADFYKKAGFKAEAGTVAMFITDMV